MVLLAITVKLLAITAWPQSKGFQRRSGSWASCMRMAFVLLKILLKPLGITAWLEPKGMKAPQER
jgi:hypothetical protein